MSSSRSQSLSPDEYVINSDWLICRDGSTFRFILRTEQEAEAAKLKRKFFLNRTFQTKIHHKWTLSPRHSRSDKNDHSQALNNNNAANNNIDENKSKADKKTSSNYSIWDISPILKILLMGCRCKESPLHKLNGFENSLIRFIFECFVTMPDHWIIKKSPYYKNNYSPNKYIENQEIAFLIKNKIIFPEVYDNDNELNNNKHNIYVNMMPFKWSNIQTVPKALQPFIKALKETLDDPYEYTTVNPNVRTNNGAHPCLVHLDLFTDIAYLTIDQAFVPNGECHRRPGLHIESPGWNYQNLNRYYSWGSKGMFIASNLDHTTRIYPVLLASPYINGPNGSISKLVRRSALAPFLNQTIKNSQKLNPSKSIDYLSQDIKEMNHSNIHNLNIFSKPLASSLFFHNKLKYKPNDDEASEGTNEDNSGAEELYEYLDQFDTWCDMRSKYLGLIPDKKVKKKNKNAQQASSTLDTEENDETQQPVSTVECEANRVYWLSDRTIHQTLPVYMQESDITRDNNTINHNDSNNNNTKKNASSNNPKVTTSSVDSENSISPDNIDNNNNAKGCIRQFIRVVLGRVSAWYDEHNTYNPLGIHPLAPILLGNKFAQQSISQGNEDNKGISESEVWMNNSEGYTKSYWDTETSELAFNKLCDTLKADNQKLKGILLEEDLDPDDQVTEGEVILYYDYLRRISSTYARPDVGQLDQNISDACKSMLKRKISSPWKYFWSFEEYKLLYLNTQSGLLSNNHPNDLLIKQFINTTSLSNQSQRSLS